MVPPYSKHATSGIRDQGSGIRDQGSGSGRRTHASRDEARQSNAALVAQSTALAQRLQAGGVDRGARVGVCVERSAAHHEDHEGLPGQWPPTKAEVRVVQDQGIFASFVLDPSCPSWLSSFLTSAITELRFVPRVPDPVRASIARVWPRRHHLPRTHVDHAHSAAAPCAPIECGEHEPAVA